MAPISQARVRAFFERSYLAKTAPEKGKALEDLVEYVFCTIPGVRFGERDVFNEFDTEEIDLAFWNNKHARGLWFLDPLVLVECKNWSSPVSSIEVAWFIAKLRSRGLSFGILVAANGVTGDARARTDAHSLIYEALSQQLRLIVITRQEIELIQDTDELIELIQRKLTKLVVRGYLF